VAAGAGKPVDVPPARVAAILAGNEASPFEITAAEVLLARWAGVPARMAYGYYGGDPTGPNGLDREVHPKHGATWLEAYFQGHGWVPLLGVPAKAKASLNNKQENPNIHPSDRVALAAYVPVRATTPRLFFEVARYWVLRVLPIALLALLFLWLYPGLVKLARRWLRRRWARRGGAREAILVAYAELRDVANDLNIGTPSDSPLEFLDRVDDDAEHAELAWLVTRALWGDLQRGVRAGDAEAAQEMAKSVAKRMFRAQPVVARLIAFGSRVSLREPFSDEIPNLWVQWAPRWSIRALRRPRAAAGVASVFVVLALVLGSCGVDGKTVRADAATPLPARRVPARLGPLAFQREPSLEKGFAKAGANAMVERGEIYSVRDGDEVKASIQLAPFKPRFTKSKTDRDEVRKGVLDGLGTGSFKPERVGNVVVLAQRGQRTNIYVWFAPDSSYFELLVAPNDFEQAPEVLWSVLAYQRGAAPVLRAADSSPLAPIDSRRGGLD
jgi:hypothetical protein